MLHAITASAERARWELVWVSKKGRIKRKDFGDDFSGALQGFAEGQREQLRFLTLRCKNVGFPPPPELRPRTIVFNPPKRINGDLVYQATVRPMAKRNRAGVWWCPYCIKLRKFTKKTGFMIDGIEVKDEALACPVCSITHRDGHVRKWNPQAVELYEGARRVVQPDARRRRRVRKEAAG